MSMEGAKPPGTRLPRSTKESHCWTSLRCYNAIRFNHTDFPLGWESRFYEKSLFCFETSKEGSIIVQFDQTYRFSAGGADSKGKSNLLPKVEGTEPSRRGFICRIPCSPKNDHFLTSLRCNGAIRSNIPILRSVTPFRSKLLIFKDGNAESECLVRWHYYTSKMFVLWTTRKSTNKVRGGLPPFLPSVDILTQNFDFPYLLIYRWKGAKPPGSSL
eukprot:scaffold13220_cov91-Cylindrotheca_fusiformis.AAC.5